MRDKAVKAVHTSEANAELQDSLDVCQMSCFLEDLGSM